MIPESVLRDRWIVLSCASGFFFFCPVFCARLPFSVSGLSDRETCRSGWVIIHRMTINHAVSLKTQGFHWRGQVLCHDWVPEGSGANSEQNHNLKSGQVLDPSCIRVGWWRCKLDFADEEKCSDLMWEWRPPKTHQQQKALQLCEAWCHFCSRLSWCYGQHI